jgi:Na+-driven multidrug efflux pump
LRIGWPAAGQHLIRTLGGMSFTVILAHTPDRDAAVAALTAGIRIEGLAFMPGIAFGIAASTMVGQNLGARQPDRAARSGWVCAQQGALVMALVGLMLWLLAEPIARVFTQDERVVHLVVYFLRINAVAEPMLGAGMVLSGALQGAGETVLPAVATVVTTWVLRLPITWWLCLGMGYDAVAAWYVMAGSTVAQGILLITWFARGRWKEKEV